MSPLIVQQGLRPRFHHRSTRAAFVSLFLLAGGLFLWTPTRALLRSFREAQRFKAIKLESPAADLSRAAGPVAGLSSPAAAKRSVTFRLLAPAAKDVSLGGTFNNFESGKNPMSRRPDGVWEASVDLPPGRYLYKFKVDGEWELDPTNADGSGEDRGGSLMEIR